MRVNRDQDRNDRSSVVARSNRWSPPRILAVTYVLIVGVGGLLLRAPFSTNEPISWIDAYFTAMSAGMVTGLSVVDTGSTFTPFGEVVLMVLMQLGGLGLMTFAVITAVLLGKRVGLSRKLLVGQSLNVGGFDDAKFLVALIVGFAIAMEVLGAVILAFVFVPEQGLGRGLFTSVFHSISAFNNAGFSTFRTNLVDYVDNPVVNVVITSLLIVGGIGFVVVADIVRRRRFARLSLHSKLMLTGTLVVNVLAMLMVLAFEWGNPATLGPLDGSGKAWAAWFQAVTPRTAGFNSVDIAGLHDHTLLMTMFLMFVGAGSASTASGIKLTTLLVIVLAVVAFLRGRSEPSAFGRSISQATVIKALAIALIGVMFLSATALALVAIEPLPMEDLLFEAVSAFGTVGLSTGITAELTTAGKLIIMALMFFGRVGPLTLAFTLAEPKPVAIRYPPDDVLAG